MKAIIAAFTSAMTNLKAKADAALETIKSPIDQITSAQEVAAAISTIRWCSENVQSWLSNVAALEAKFDEELTSAVAAEISAKVAAGEFMAKADVETAIGAAEKKGRDAAEAAFAQAAAEAKVITLRRNEIEAAHGADVAASVSDDSLKGDDAAFAIIKSELGRRVSELSSIGVTAASKKEAFAEIACGIPFSPEGNQSFDARLVTIKQLVGPVAPGSATAAASQASTAVPGSGQPPATAAAAAASSAQSTSEPAEVSYGF
jgi:hypothetical protein